MLDKQKNQGAFQPYLRNVNVRWYEFDLSDLLQMPFEESENERYSICFNDLVVCEGGEPGRCAIWNSKEPIKFQKALHRVRCHEGISNKYLLNVLKLFFANGILENYYTGSTIKHLTGDSLNSVLIPLPPFAEQKRIVVAIEQWFTIIDLLEKAKDELQSSITQTKSKILDLAIHGKLVPQDPNDEPSIELLKRINPSFVPCDNAHYENVPQGWSEIKVGELAQYTNGKAFQPSDWEQCGLPIIRIQNLNDENCKYNYTSITHEEKYKISNGDLLFAWAASLGVYIWKGDDAWLNQHIFKVEPFPFIDKQFLYYIFQYLISEFYVRSHGSGMVHITKKEFETTIALLPPLCEQRRIVKSIESYYATLNEIISNL